MFVCYCREKLFCLSVVTLIDLLFCRICRIFRTSFSNYLEHLKRKAQVPSPTPPFWKCCDLKDEDRKITDKSSARRPLVVEWPTLAGEAVFGWNDSVPQNRSDSRDSFLLPSVPWIQFPASLLVFGARSCELAAPIGYKSGGKRQTKQ